jgi:hypothetical protein
MAVAATGGIGSFPDLSAVPEFCAARFGRAVVAAVPGLSRI